MPAPPAWRSAAGSPAPPMRAPPPMTPRSRSGSPGKRRETFPPLLTVAAKRKQSLRYGENPHQQAAFYVGGERRPGVATADAAPGQRAQLQQSQRYRRCLRAGRRIRASRPSPSSSTPIPAASPWARRSPRPSPRRSPAIPSVPSAASSPSTARSMRRPPKPFAKLFAEVVIAPALAPDAQAAFQRRTQLRLLVAGALPDPAAPGRRCARSPAATCCRRATTAASAPPTSRP